LTSELLPSCSPSQARRSPQPKYAVWACKLPTRGAVLLFGRNRASIFPHAQIRCARFDGLSPERFIDSLDIDENLPTAVDTAIAFVERNTRKHSEIGRLTRQETTEYPVQAVRGGVELRCGKHFATAFFKKNGIARQYLLNFPAYPRLPHWTRRDNRNRTARAAHESVKRDDVMPMWRVDGGQLRDTRITQNKCK
jgi:hypothetical protein